MVGFEAWVALRDYFQVVAWPTENQDPNPGNEHSTCSWLELALDFWNYSGKLLECLTVKKQRTLPQLVEAFGKTCQLLFRLDASPAPWSQ